MGSPGPRERLRFNRDSYQPWIVGDRRYPPFVVFNGLPVVAAWWPNRRASMLGQVECAGGQP